MIISANLPVFTKGTFDEKVQRIAKAGYNGLGINISVVDCVGKYIGDLTEGEIIHFKKQIEGFKKVSLHASHFEVNPLAIHPEYRKISQEEYFQSIIVAGKMGVETVVLHPCNPPQLPNHISFDFDVDDVMNNLMFKIDKLAGENNVTACWETGCGYFSPFEKFELIRELNLENTGICLDIGHMVLAWENYEIGVNKNILTIKEFIRRFGDIIYDIHIHDWVKNLEKSPHGWPDHNLIGTGDINWEDVFSSIIECGYDGILTCEYHPFVVKDSEKILYENRKHIINMIEQLGGKAI